MKKIKKLGVIAISLVALFTTIFSYIAEAEATPVTVPAGYHATYHNSGNYTDWGETIANCNNYSTYPKTRQCVHYLNFWITNGTNEGQYNYLPGSAPTSASDPRFKQAFQQWGWYGFWYDGGIALLTINDQIWLLKKECVWTNWYGNAYGIGIYDNGVWNMFNYASGSPVYIGAAGGTSLNGPSGFNAGGTGTIDVFNDMRFYFVDRSTKCAAAHNGKFVKSLYSAWGFDSAMAGEEVPAVNYSKLFSRNCGGMSNVFLGGYTGPGSSDERTGHYFYGYENLHEVKQYSSGLGRSEYPSYTCALGYTGKGFNGYDSNGNVIWDYNAAEGYELEGFTHTVYRYKCDGHLVPNTYTVVYNGNGATGGSTANSSHTYDTAKNLNSNGYTKTNYHFVGWSTSSGSSTVSYTNTQSVKNLTTTNGGVVTLYAVWEPNNAPYKVYHQQEQLDGTYITVETETKEAMIGSTVTPPVKTYTGFNSPSTQNVTILANGSASVTYRYTRKSYDVTFIDVVDGVELGRTTQQRKYGATVNGNEIGGSTADNAYYPNYRIISTTSSTVGTSGAVVYRYFEWITVDVEGNVSWTDNHGNWNTRPEQVKVALFQNKVGVSSVAGPKGKADVSTSPIVGLSTLGNDSYGFSFKKLPMYDSNGNKYVYEVRQGNAGEAIEYSNPSHVSSMVNPEDKYVTSQNGYNIINALDNTAQDPDNPDIPADSSGFHVDGAIHWEDSGNKLGYRPSVVTVSIYQDGQPFIRDGEHYTITVDAKNSNMFSFIRLPKYKYVDGQPVPYEYTAVETVKAFYVVDGEIVPAYDIHVDEEYGSYKPLHFTNYLNIPDGPFIPITPEKTNTITVKTNTEDEIQVTLKMLDYIIEGTPDAIDRIDGPGYNGIEYDVSVDKIGEIIKEIPSGKYEIYVNEEKYELKDIVIEDNTDNVKIVSENGKYYLVIEDVPEDSEGTIVIDLSRRDDYYQSRSKITNYFANNTTGAAVISVFDDAISAETDIVTAQMPSYSVKYEESDVFDKNIYDYGDVTVISNFTGKIPDGMTFVHWIDQNDKQVMPGDKVIMSEDIFLYPVFELEPDKPLTVSGNDIEIN